jgi:hypothetical protein
MRRERIETGIYKSSRARGRWVYEIGWYDKDGKQRWMTIGDDLELARKMRKEHAANGVGGASKYKVNRKDLFRIAQIADTYPSPTKRDFVDIMRQTTQEHPRRAWIMLAGFALARARSYEKEIDGGIRFTS